MGQAFSTVLVVWGIIGLLALLIGVNALADFGAKRLRELIRRHSDPTTNN